MKVTWDFGELEKFADNLVNADLTKCFETSAKKIAQVLLKHMKGLTPKGESGELIRGWDDNDFLVKPVKNGYLVEIVNTAEYAKWVNDGHMAYNQYGGPYPIHDEVSIGPFGKLQGRVKVTSAHPWQKGDPTYYVFGHFFVERGILQLQNTTEIERIIMKELEKWWRSV